MGLTKRHFSAIADIIKKNSRTEVDHLGYLKNRIITEHIVNDLVLYFQQENTNFKPEIFKESCYVNYG